MIKKIVLLLLMTLAVVGCSSVQERQAEQTQQLAMYAQAIEASKTSVQCTAGCTITVPGKVQMPKAATNGWDMLKFAVGTAASTINGATPWYFGAEVLKAGFDAAGQNITTTTTTTDSYNSESIADSYNTSTPTTSYADSYNDSTADPTIVQIPTQVIQPIVVQP